MAFGILETKVPPPGTVILERHEESNGNGKQVVLVPEPSESPQDPLNMPKVRKELFFLALIYGACITGVVGPVLVPGFSIVASNFQVGLSKVALLNGALIMALGVSSYLCAPLACVLGRRLVFLGTTLILIIGCIWAAVAQSYGSLIGARALQGLGMGSFFAVAGTNSINDVFFVHQRGRRVGLWNFAVIVSVNAAPIISGFLITSLGWRWSFWMLAISFGVALVLVVIVMPETYFPQRDQLIGIGPEETTPKMHSDKEISDFKSAGLSAVSNSQKNPSMEFSVVGQDNIATSAWKKALGIETVQFKSLKELMSMLATPLFLLQHPVVLWSCAMWSTTFSWTIIQGAVADQIFAAPPYNLSPITVGLLIGIPPLIGSAFGTLISGWMCDLAAQSLALRNGGVYEPEFRLLVMVPAFIASGVGGFGLGIAISQGMSIWTCAVFLGILNFAVGVGCTGIIAYTNDVCRENAGNAFGITMLVKSAFAFGISFILNDFYATHGAKVFFSTWTALNLGLILTTIPMYIFGKYIRGFAKNIGVAK